MKKDWLCHMGCIIAPHIMIVVGLIFLSRGDNRKKMLGKKLCGVSTLVLIAGSFLYYIFFTPIFGLD
ncbi:MAG: hypothetical protein HQ547_03140 [Candidatus Omnitrophica bacterium]|nr:hypothetical protein [Candidatus Omnitrophota bacterium]